MNELEAKLNFTEVRADMYEKRFEKTMDTIKVFKIGILQILEKIDATDLLPEEKVTESNLMQFLGIIELRTNEILQIFKFCQKGSNDSPIESMVVDDNEKKPLKIVVPGITDKENDADEASVVLNKKDFLDRLQVKMQDIRK